MKGFIEVRRTETYELMCINIDSISYFMDGYISHNCSGKLYDSHVFESYEEIKELIKNAQ